MDWLIIFHLRLILLLTQCEYADMTLHTILYVLYKFLYNFTFSYLFCLKWTSSLKMDQPASNSLFDVTKLGGKSWFRFQNCTYACWIAVSLSVSLPPLHILYCLIFCFQELVWIAFLVARTALSFSLPFSVHLFPCFCSSLSIYLSIALTPFKVLFGTDGSRGMHRQSQATPLCPCLCMMSFIFNQMKASQQFWHLLRTADKHGWIPLTRGHRF